MRMEELSEARYLKRADSVEAYLLGLIQDYFSKVGTAPEGSIEHIIERCVSRMNEDLEYDGVGVTGVMLPDDTEPRVGTVNISLEELHGEPKIETKHTAFNVDFGDMMNTACEGNDPRLSDPREPLPHSHSMNDIQGLNGKLSTIDGKVNRALSMAHEHPNMSALNKIIYTGNKPQVDLANLEQGEERFRTEIDNTQITLNTYNDSDELRKQELEDAMDVLTGSAGSVQNFIEQSNANSLAQAKQYTDEKITEADNLVKAQLAPYAKSDFVMLKLNTLLTNTYTIVGNMIINVTEQLNFDSEHEYKELTLTSNISDELTRRGITISDCIVNSMLSYVDDNNNMVNRQLPYIYTGKAGEPIGSMTVKTVNSSNKIALESYIYDIGSFSNEIYQSTITLTFLSKQGTIE